MNSEKSYDSLPNFTAADCKYLIMLKVTIRVCLGACMLLFVLSCVFNLKRFKPGNSKQHCW